MRKRKEQTQIEYPKILESIFINCSDNNGIKWSVPAVSLLKYLVFTKPNEPETKDS